MSGRVLCVLFVVIVFVEAVAQKKTPEEPNRTRVMPTRHVGVIQEPHQQYTHVDARRKRRLTLDLYRPAKVDGSFPAIVMFHGGGWMNGRPGQFAALAQALAVRGYVCVVPQFRLSSEKPFPAAVYDCKAAIRWTRKNASRYNSHRDHGWLGRGASGRVHGCEQWRETV